MVKPWLVRLGLARDDGRSLSEDGIRELTDLLTRNGVLVLVTGEPQFIADAVREVVGAGQALATRFQLADGLFTGEIERRMATAYEKERALKPVLYGVDSSQSFAFGDSIGDEGMLRSVDRRICVGPDPDLRRVAIREGWAIVRPGQVVARVRRMLGSTS